MIITRLFMDQSWTDLNSPTKEELDSLVLAQNMDPLIAKDLLAPTPKQYAKEFGEAIYAVIHIPSFRHSHSQSFEQEIDLIITKNSLITARYDSIDAIHHFGKQIEVEQILNKDRANSHMLFGLMKEIYKFLGDEIEYMKDWMKEIEKNIFEGHEKDMVFSISQANRNILSFRRTIGPHRAVWSKLLEISKESFGEKFYKDTKTLLEELDRLDIDIKNIYDMLDELRATNDSILSTKQNEVMKIFTILAFVTLPLSLISSLFGMNASSMPLVENPYGFWMVLGIMIFTGLAMFSFFKYKKWI